MVSQLRTISGSLPEAPLPAVRRHPMLRAIDGTVQVFTSQHRTFFTNVMVQAMRLADQGISVLVVQFLKGGIGQGPDQPMRMGQRLDWIRCNSPECVQGPTDTSETIDAIQALWLHTQSEMRQGNYGLVVLDELSLAIDFGLIQENEVLTLLKERPTHVDVVLTGPQMPNSLLSIADQVTEFKRNYLV